MNNLQKFLFETNNSNLIKIPKHVKQLTIPLHIETWTGAYGRENHLTCRVTTMMPIKDIVTIKGHNNEDRKLHLVNTHKFGEMFYFGNYQIDDWNNFLADIAKNGIENPIMIMVKPEGVTTIIEGNHRIQAAIQLGLNEVPVKISFYGQSQWPSSTNKWIKDFCFTNIKKLNDKNPEMLNKLKDRGFK